MSSAAFNADYWTAIATIAPVLALANTVAMAAVARAYRLPDDYREEVRSHVGSGISHYVRRKGRSIALVNYVLQAIVTTAALVSLADQHELSWLPAPIIGLVVVSFALIAWQTISLAPNEPGPSTGR
jgi:hypothetical protein